MKNIVLIGMPLSGKSTIGRELSKKLQLLCYDLDICIENYIDMSISDYFKKYGEEKFRDIEMKIVDKYSKNNSTIISTGGGVINREENINNLKKNGIIFFINRNIEDILDTVSIGRPLIKDKEDIMKIYNNRYKKYEKYSDYIINTNNDIMKAVNEIINIYKDEYEENIYN